ncbi:MAG: methylenetetrahydrofolate--tRNA-(uracil(54)-C(5))-methyltransferase (FADH(2)-oxidizing) TrmFO [Clostridia bacterium]|nr:methylenetetrahydrofolate--tRNA-(uracil(54)-C(5))-methyltransferase (FADH(2)-oxidizing) TrmFO [Clostridia bacterium]
MNDLHATVVGAGLAGCEAAMQLANRGVQVTLYEMKPHKMTPAHTSTDFGELVCSNSLKAKRVEAAGGLLKAEMQLFDSLCVKTAYACEVPAGGALAVNRHEFSAAMTRAIQEHPNITVVEKEITEIPDGVCVIATGPLTSDAFAQELQQKIVGSPLHFYDAAAPIVTADSIDMNSAFAASRYERGGEDDYLNCPMNKEEYEAFYEQLITAQRAQLHAFEKDPKVYEGCMPIEIMARRGADTIRFGPLKPVGLRDPRTGHRPWANLQLRKENKEGTCYNLVGFQTNLTFPEQKRVFGMIPALKNAEYVRYGVMHRNTFLDSPRLLNQDFSLKENPDLFFAGQMTGVEGYMESAASGILAGVNAYRRLTGQASLALPETTMMGALSRHIGNQNTADFQPMGASFGLLPPLPELIRDKKERYGALARRSLETLQSVLQYENLFVSDK